MNRVYSLNRSFELYPIFANYYEIEIYFYSYLLFAITILHRSILGYFQLQC